MRNDVGRFGEVVEAAVVADPRSALLVARGRALRGRHESRGASFEYNETSYSREGGTPYSGWCTAEEGAASFVIAHLQGDVCGSAARALCARERADRLTDLSGGEAQAVVVTVEPVELLEQTFEGATFVGKGDRVFVHTFWRL